MCEAVTALNCPEHPGDSAEPDDCLSRAVTLSTAATTQRQQIIEPVGDYDFFRIDGKPRTVYSITVEPGSGALMPRGVRSAPCRCSHRAAIRSRLRL